MNVAAFNKSVNDSLKFLDNDLIKNGMRLALLLYASMAAPRLPMQMAALFDNVFFKMAVLFLIVWFASKDPAMSILLAVGFVVSANHLSGRKLLEAFNIEQNTNVFPDCLGIKMNDLLQMFDGDESALKMALRNAHAPLSIEFNDDRAPLLATYLINYGYDLSDMCQLPPKN